METKKEREERLEDAREERKEEAKEEAREEKKEADEAKARAAIATAVAAAAEKKPVVDEKATKAAHKIEVKEARKKEILKLLEDCLAEYGGETNVPYTHEYWGWVKEFRSLQ